MWPLKTLLLYVTFGISLFNFASFSMLLSQSRQSLYPMLLFHFLCHLSRQCCDLQRT
jgi:hypothetical protein